MGGSKWAKTPVTSSQTCAKPVYDDTAEIDYSLCVSFSFFLGFFSQRNAKTPRDKINELSLLFTLHFLKGRANQKSPMLGFSSAMVTVFPCEMRLQCCWCTPECTGLENVVAVRNKSKGIGFRLSQTLSCEAALLLKLTARTMWSSIYMLIRRSICRAKNGVMRTCSLGCHSALAGIKCRGPKGELGE